MIITGSYRTKEIFLSPDNSYGYITIPKNASTWTSNYLIGGWNWRPRKYKTSMLLEEITEYNNIKLLVVLRDPVERWCSGLTEFLWDISNEYDWVDYIENNIKRKIAVKITYDAHTELQCNFLHNIDTEKCLFFYMDDTYERTFRKFCHKTFIGQFYGPYLNKNSSDSYAKRLRVKELLLSYCEDPTYKEFMYDYYKKDYELINSVKFYGQKSS